jgi:hypothetical protein
MAFASDPRFLVLHGLRLKGFCDTDSLSSATGLRPADVDRHLNGLKADELVLCREGRLSGWCLTPAGRGEHARLIGDETERSGIRPMVEAAYERFVAINTDLLAACTDWQTQPDRKQAAIDRLVAIDAAVQPVCDDLADAAARFSAYGPRLREAQAKVQAGESDWFTKPLIDSYHTVWFELHEDLLSTLGKERASEESKELA